MIYANQNLQTRHGDVKKSMRINVQLISAD